MKKAAPSVICLLLAAITLLVYLPVRQHSFLLFDDADYVTDNRMVQQGLSWAGVKWAFTTAHSSNWHPVTWLSHMLDAQLFVNGAAGPHLVNLFLHIANTILLFILLHRLTGALWRSTLVAALFALHPLHVESVAWVAERKDVLSAFFGFLTLLFYVGKWRVEGGELRVKTASPLNSPSPSLNPQLSTLNYFAALLCFALALMSKPMLVTLPFVMLLLDYWPLRRFAIGNDPAKPSAIGDWRLAIRPLVVEKLPFFALSALSCVVTFIAQEHGGTVRSLASFPVTERIGNALVSYERYLTKTFWPMDLAIFYPHPGHWPAGQIILAAAVIAAACFAALWFARKSPFATTGWFWFFGMLIPTIGLIQVSNQSMADRYMYLPLIGVFILLAWGAEAFTRHRAVKTAIGIAAGLAVVACAARTADQLRYWRDGETLFRHALAVTKDNFVAHNNLGNALLQKGEIDDAIDQFRITLKLRPDYADARCNLGAALLRKGARDEAVVQFRQALELQPDHAMARYNLATALLQAGQVNDALAEFQKALERRPGDGLARINFGNALLQAGQIDAAIVQYQKVVELQPDHADAHNNIGTALLRRGKVSEAAGHFERTLEIQPRHANAHNNLAEIFLQQGQLDKAIDHYRKSLAIESANAEAHNNLANALLQSGRMDEAIVHLQSALAIRPDFAEAHSNLGYVLIQTGHAREAVAHYEAALKLQPENIATLASFAWVLATCADAPVRNGSRAIELAGRANQLSGGQDPMVLHSLAAAYAEAGKFAEAVNTAQRALQLAETQSNSALAEMLRAETKVYQSGAPFREAGHGSEGQN